MCMMLSAKDMAPDPCKDVLCPIYSYVVRSITLIVVLQNWKALDTNKNIAAPDPCLVDENMEPFAVCHTVTADQSA